MKLDRELDFGYEDDEIIGVLITRFVAQEARGRNNPGITELVLGIIFCLSLAFADVPSPCGDCAISTPLSVSRLSLVTVFNRRRQSV